RARARAVQAPAGRGGRQVGGLRPVGPLVGVGDAGGAASAEDGAPDRRGGVDADLVLRVGGDVGGEPVELGPVDRGGHAGLLDDAAAGRGVDAVPAVVARGRDLWQLDVGPDNRVRDVLAPDARQRLRGLAGAPVGRLRRGAVPVRVNAGAAHVPVGAGADADVVLGVVLVRLVGV